MITRRFKGFCQIFKNAGPYVRNRRGLPMHQFRRSHNLAAEDFGNALVTKTNSEQRNLGAKVANDIATDSRVARPARAGRNANLCRTQSLNVPQRGFVVAFHHNICAELTKNLRQVIGERIVIIDQEKHNVAQVSNLRAQSNRKLETCATSFARSIAVSTAIALRSVSSRSLTGSESATMPAPACTYAFPFFKTTERNAMQLSQFQSKPNQPTAPA